MNSYYTYDEIAKIGLKEVGEDVSISKKCSIYGAKNISIGNNVRIDDFCILSGNITIGNYVHIGAYSGLFAGDAGIVFEDFSSLSSKVSLYAVSDDYGGDFMTNPTVPAKFKNEIKGTIRLCRHTIIGASSVILPGVTLSAGTAIGALSLVLKSTLPWSIYAGSPAKKIRERSKLLLEKESILGMEKEAIDE
ncbi:MAG: acyltransferase [Eubacteriales bacterium]|nr:acyltransferase [Eubacteriales bacterium]